MCGQAELLFILPGPGGDASPGYRCEGRPEGGAGAEGSGQWLEALRSLVRVGSGRIGETARRATLSTVERYRRRLGRPEARG